MFRRMQQWYLIPALIFLVITVISGTWMRLQWAWPQWEIPKFLLFRTDFLIHGHSHAALLGWVFLGLAGFVLEAGTRHRRLPLTGLSLLGGFTAVLTLLMFLAFVREGYAPFSIALSTVHMLAGYIFAWIFFRNARTDNNTGSRYFLEGAVFWMVMATAGTWLLAAGRGLPPFWMNVAVQYYLHVLFNGWFLFALAGLAYRYVIAPRFRRINWPFWLMMAGLIPAMIPHLELTDIPAGFTLLGALGTILFAAGGMGVIVLILKSGRPIARSADNPVNRTADTKAGKTTGKKTDKMADNTQNTHSVVYCNNYRFLFWPGLISTVLVLLLPVAMAWPDFRSTWLQSNFLVIGYIHLHLLTAVSTLLIYGLLRIHSYEQWKRLRIYRQEQWKQLRIHSHDQRKPLHIHRQEQRKAVSATLSNRNTTIPAVLFVTGSVLMVVILFTTGWYQVQGNIPPYPIRKTLFFTGLLTTLGTVRLAAILIPGLVGRGR